MSPLVALKIDVDTDRGTRIGVPRLARLCRELGIPACFLFSLGPDNTGKAITRIFRPGFFQKVSRTSVVSTYGVRTLLNGTLLPAPHIGRRRAGVMREVRDAGFETGIHCYDHYLWQDHVLAMAPDAVAAEFNRARDEYRRIFGHEAHAAGAPGWQACAASRHIYDTAGLLYASDTRGSQPYFPRIGDEVFTSLEIPTTLPTFDELLGRLEYPDAGLPAHYARLLREDRLNVFTLHAEIEGMRKFELFREVLLAWRKQGARFIRLDEHARELLCNRDQIPVREFSMAPIDGRSGVVATQAA